MQTPVGDLAVPKQLAPFQFDPVGDWMKWTRGELVRNGYEVCSKMPLHDVARLWLNVQMRMIEAKPRSLYVARGFDCRKEERAAVEEIKRRARSGRDLNRHLSKGLRRADFNDALLFDWGLHHFHLGSGMDRTGFVRRSDRILLARVTSDDFFVVAIRSHGRWADSDLFEIVHRNWPESIASFKLDCLPAQRSAFSESERLELRNAGVSLLPSTKDGTVYAPTGGGYSTSGASIELTMQLDKTVHYLEALQEYVARNAFRIKGVCWRNGINPNNVHLRLRISEEYPNAWDEAQGLRIELPLPG